MPGRPPTRTLLIGFCVSLVLHAAAAALLLWVWWDDERAPRTPDPVAEREPKRDQARIELGDPQSSAITMTWIGFEEYVEHAAAPSTIDQPALSMEQPSPPMTPSPREMIAPAAQAVTQTVDAWRERVASAASALMAAAERAAQLQASARPTERPAPSRGQDAPDDPAPNPPDQGERAEAEPGAPETEATERLTEQRTPPAETPTTPGRADEREADPTSIVEADLSLGKPLSARGLKIYTRSPNFTHVTRATARPAPPVVLIKFKHDGTVYAAEILRSSGYESVDGPILDAVYEWRAEGEALERLKSTTPPDTFGIEVRILL